MKRGYPAYGSTQPAACRAHRTEAPVRTENEAGGRRGAVTGGALLPTAARLQPPGSPSAPPGLPPPQRERDEASPRPLPGHGAAMSPAASRGRLTAAARDPPQPNGRLTVA